MSLTKDGFYKQIGGVTGDNSYLLLGGGGLIKNGNASGNVPISNGTLNVNLNADLLDGYHYSSFSFTSHTHKIKLGATEITVPSSGSAPTTVTSIIGPFAVNTQASSDKAFSIQRESSSEGVQHWVDDAQYHIDYTNDETSSSIHIRLINTDTESPHNPRQTTDYHVYLDSSGNFYPGSNNTGSIGTSSYKWANMYATTFHGSLEGNASTATKLATSRLIWGQSFDGSSNVNGNIYIDTGDNDRFIQFRYNTNNYAGASWRLISRGSGSGDTNYFDIETGGSNSSANTWYRVIRLTMDNRYVGIGTDTVEKTLDVNGITQIYQRGNNNSAFRNLLLIKQQNSTEPANDAWDTSKPSFGIGFTRYWTNSSSKPYGETVCAGIYSTVSSSWRGGLVFRTKWNQTESGSPDVTALRLTPSGQAIFESINDWFTLTSNPARIQIGRPTTTAYTDRSCIGTTNGNLHIDPYYNANAGTYSTYINYYSNKGYTYFNGSSYWINNSGQSNMAIAHLLINNATWWSNWYWSGQSGQPTWIWGSNDGTNMYVWNPSNFRVNYANSAGNSDTVDGYHANDLRIEIIDLRKYT